MSNLHYDATKDLIVGSTEMTEAQKKFLDLHEEMHRQFGRMSRPAKVAPDMVINPIIFDVSGSMTAIPEDNSGSMGGTDMSKILADLMRTPIPYSGTRHMMVITDGDPAVMRKFPKPKYEKFTSTEAMIEEKLLTGRNRRSNKEIAAVRYESRRLNKKRTAAQSRIKRHEKKNGSVMMFEDRSGSISSEQMAEFLKEIHLLKTSEKNTED